MHLQVILFSTSLTRTFIVVLELILVNVPDELITPEGEDFSVCNLLGEEMAWNFASNLRTPQNSDGVPICQCCVALQETTAAYQ